MAKQKDGGGGGAASNVAQALQKKREEAGKWLADMWRNRMAPVQLDDTPQPKYVEPGKASPEQLEQNRKLWEEANSSRMVKFLLKSEELTLKKQEEDAKRFGEPLHGGEKALWKKLPPVPGPFGVGKLVRRGLANDKEEATNVFLDFFRNFHLNLWGFQPRANPPQKPFDIQQVVGSKFLEKRYYDFTMRGGSWYYKDRLGRTRGPCEVVNLKTAWAGGIIDKNTMVWGDDMDEFAPICMVYGLQAAVATPDVQLAAMGTFVAHRLGLGRNPFAPRKGHERKSLKQLQEEAIDEKDREKNIMRNSGGFWPGTRIPSHALFLWAGGGELSKLLNRRSSTLPDKYISYETRKELAQAIPGLRPWEVLEVEQLYNYLTFHDNFWRYTLGNYTTPPEFIEAYKEEEVEEWSRIKDALTGAFPEFER